MRKTARKKTVASQIQQTGANIVQRLEARRASNQKNRQGSRVALNAIFSLQQTVNAKPTLRRELHSMNVRELTETNWEFTLNAPTPKPLVAFCLTTEAHGFLGRKSSSKEGHLCLAVLDKNCNWHALHPKDVDKLLPAEGLPIDMHAALMAALEQLEEAI